MTADTIYAISTGTGQAGLAVIRISGPEASAVLAALTGELSPVPRRMTRALFCDPETGDPLDDGMAVCFAAPASYTGEDVVELHLHGGPAVLAAVLAALGRRPGLRHAEPGEFTRRAFLAGKIDLTETEGIADLIAAETEAQRRQALRQTRGELGRLYESWRTPLLEALAHLEAHLDFPDEGLEDGGIRGILDNALIIKDKIEVHLDDDRRGEHLREGVFVTILGPPNAGKSSLLNWLACRDAAIVAEQAGTTRDVIEVRLDLAGCPVVLADTAGLREAATGIESEGIRRALDRAEDADIRIVIFDGQDAEAAGPARRMVDAETLVVLNKADLGPPLLAFDEILKNAGPFSISVHEEIGLDDFLEALTRQVAAKIDAGGAAVITRARHREALADCLAALQHLETAVLPELAAEDMRLAVRALGRITGAVDVEDLLDIIFRDFCIGK